MKQRSRLFMVLAIVLMLAMVLAACGGGDEPRPGTHQSTRSHRSTRSRRRRSPC